MSEHLEEILGGIKRFFDSRVKKLPLSDRYEVIECFIDELDGQRAEIEDEMAASIVLGDDGDDEGNDSSDSE